MKVGKMAGLLLVVLAGFAFGGVDAVMHWQLQAVNGDGWAGYSSVNEVSVTGIILNNPEEMLDSTPREAGMGGEWQIYVQGEGSDHAGTCVWYGQNYSTVSSSDDYTDEELLAEMCRINHDDVTGYMFQAGDRVRVTGWFKFYKGKMNINEKHEISDFYNFQIELITPGAGLPAAEVVTLDAIKNGGNNYIFDATRMSGCEYYQGRLLRVEDVNVLDPQNWAAGGTVTVMDGTGRTFPVKLGLGKGFSRYGCPEGQIAVVGIMDQEASQYMVCKDGYRIWVTDYDGNWLVVADRDSGRGNLAGDVNGDFTVNFLDMAELANTWLECEPGLCDCE